MASVLSQKSEKKAETKDTPAATPSQPDAAAKSSARLNALLRFGEIISLLMKTPSYRHHTLADLEWLVVPPVKANQYVVAEASARDAGQSVPVGIALWAKVSAEVDAKLSKQPNAQIRPDEWNSGDIYWVIVAAGDRRVLNPMLKSLQEKTFGGKPFKIAQPGNDGKIQIATISEIKHSEPADDKK